MVARARPGRSSLGCLVTLLLLTAVGYFGVNAGEAWLRFYEFQDAMKQEARFASRRSDDDINHRLRAKADSLGLPPEAAKSIRVRRTTRVLRIRAEYSETIEMPLVTRELHFEPKVETSF